jgi:hypothetical protein
MHLGYVLATWDPETIVASLGGGSFPVVSILTCHLALSFLRCDAGAIKIIPSRICFSSLVNIIIWVTPLTAHSILRSGIHPLSAYS